MSATMVARPEPCPVWHIAPWPEGHDEECPACGALAAWEPEAWERVTVAARVFVARTLELWPDQGPDELDPAGELGHAFTYLQRHPEAWPSDRPRRRPINGAIRIQVFERDAFRCVKCGSWENLTVDHIVPVVAGGAHHLDNFQTLCGSCNAAKGAR